MARDFYFPGFSLYRLSNELTAIFNLSFFFKLFVASLSLTSSLLFMRHIVALSQLRLSLLHLATRSLGVKFFIDKGSLFLDLGYSHYCVIKVPAGLKLYPKKKNLYLMSLYPSILSAFSYLILRLKRFSVYKSKGLIPYSRLKYMRLKLGKKQQ